MKPIDDESLAAAVRRAQSCLDKDDLTTVMLHYCEDMTEDEIIAVQGRSSEQIRAALASFRALVLEKRPQSSG